MTKPLLQFTKMHGGGNDFVMIDAVRQQLPITVDFRLLANRRIGIGCDQILILQTPQHPDADFQYRIINADGGEVGQCGNGARCAHVFARRQALSDKTRLRLQTSHTIVTTENTGEGIVRAELAVPQFAPAAIPLAGREQADFYTAANIANGDHFAALSLGNPHAVFFVADESTAEVAKLGAAFNHARALFPAGVNVGFCRVIDTNTLALRVYERGVGETPSCGSGAVAATVAALRTGRARAPVRVLMPGATLHCGWESPTASAWLEGPIVHVFDGTIRLSDFGG